MMRASCVGRATVHAVHVGTSTLAQVEVLPWRQGPRAVTCAKHAERVLQGRVL